MGKAIETSDLRIHCDLCHHEFPGDPPAWLDKACPECGQGVLITAEDLSIWQGMHAALDVVNELFGDVADDTPCVEFSFDTSSLRTGAAV